MITINNSIELLTASINEAYKEVEGEWKKVVIIRFPSAEYSLSQATDIANEATTVENTTKDKVIVYYVGGLLEVQTKGDYFDFWLENPNVEITDNLATKVAELESIINALVGGEE